MKKFLILSIFLVLGTYEIHAQYGGMYGRGRGYGNGMGMGRRNSLPQAGPSESKQEEPKPSEIVAERLPDYQAEFDLDAFEIEVLKNTLENYYAELLSIQKEQTKDAEALRESFKRTQEELKVNLSGILSKEEVEELVAMDFSPKARKKREKKRKDKN